MNLDEITKRLTAPYRKGLFLSWAALACSVILVNTPAANLGYWMFGAALSWIGVLIGIISTMRSSLVLFSSAKKEEDGVLLISDGISLHASTERIEPIKGIADYSRIKGTVFLFKLEESSEQSEQGNRIAHPYEP